MKNPVMSRHESGIVTGSFASAQDDDAKKNWPRHYGRGDSANYLTISASLTFLPLSLEEVLPLLIGGNLL